MADEIKLSPHLEDSSASMSAVNGGGIATGQEDDAAARGQKRSRQSAAVDDDDDDDQTGTRERRKIEIKFIGDKSRRHITFSKRKAGIMKKVSKGTLLPFHGID